MGNMIDALEVQSGPTENDVGSSLLGGIPNRIKKRKAMPSRPDESDVTLLLIPPFV